jgi:hypothetical protein
MIAVGSAENWDVQHMRLPFNLAAVAVGGNKDPINVFGGLYLARIKGIISECECEKVRYRT